MQDQFIAQSAERRGKKMEKKIPEGIDLHNIRSREQLKATLSWWETGQKSGCTTWCNREGQKSPIVFETTHWECRQEHPDFKKPGADRFFLILKRHASLNGIFPEEWADYGAAKQKLHKEYDIKGCFIHRCGPKENTASSLSDDHYFENAVRTTPGVPYKETLVKDLTGSNLERLEKRAEEIAE